MVLRLNKRWGEVFSPIDPTAASTQSVETEQASMLCIGPMSVDRLVFKSDGTELLYPGGNAVITGCIMAAMGLKTTIAGQVGADTNGRIIRDLLNSHGADTSELHLTATYPTRVGRNIVDKTGAWQRESATPGRVPYLSDAHAVLDLERFTHVHAGGLNSLILSSPIATVQLLDSASDIGLGVSFGLAGLYSDPELFKRTIRSSNFLFCTIDEFQGLNSSQFERPQEVVKRLVTSRFENCAMTMGSLGVVVKWRGEKCLYTDAKGESLIEATVSKQHEILEIGRLVQEKVDRRVSDTASCTVGAGDVLVGVFIAALVAGRSIGDVLQLSAKAASLSVRDRTWDGWISTAKDLDELVALRTIP